jgi:hypothetical protein
VNGARAALAGIAADMRTGQSRLVAQQTTRNIRSSTSAETGLSLTVNLIADTRSCRVVFHRSN